MTKKVKLPRKPLVGSQQVHIMGLPDKHTSERLDLVITSEVIPQLIQVLINALVETGEARWSGEYLIGDDVHVITIDGKVRRS